VAGLKPGSRTGDGSNIACLNLSGIIRHSAAPRSHTIIQAKYARIYRIAALIRFVLR
jgi:hypothetical protein